MNGFKKLVIIGNGFDLAYGLKTSYKDFINWYLIEKVKIGSSYCNYEDSLILINFSDERGIVNEGIVNLNNLFRSISRSISSSNQTRVKSPFLSKILKIASATWVDIENEYFNSLVDCFENINQPISMYKQNVEVLNNDLEQIKNYLIEYLDIVSKEKNKNKDVVEFLNNELGYSALEQNDVLFLNLNYTDTLESFIGDKQIIYYHGKLNDEDNPIIFGYGDELHPKYSLFKDDNSYTINMKHFSYLLTDNTSRLSKFINSEYEVHLWGHSCGISDRLLLNKIFNHPNCHKIKTTYYQSKQDYIDKAQNIQKILVDSEKLHHKLVTFPNSVTIKFNDLL
ncbi:MAG: hypothetical protein RLZZ175_2493 [Bacteroidota bacterium]|jgi:hypothetical protein